MTNLRERQTVLISTSLRASLIVLVAIAWAGLGLAASDADRPASRESRKQATERDGRLPRLGFRQEPHPTHTFLPLVRMSFPSVRGSTCEAWCYESDVEFLDVRPLDEGRLQLRHRWRSQPHVVFVTTVTPEPGAVEFTVRAVADRQRAQDATLPKSLLPLNLCFQLRPATRFQSQPDPYPEFVRRCFIFTERGRTFLLDTHRRKILHRFPTDDPKNNPPWVQMYVGAWRPVPPVQGKGWAEYSTDRYTVPIIGVVSRDGKSLIAIANGSADMLCNAWHDCLHNNPKWEPAERPPGERRWRLKVYAMPNEPDRLLSRVTHDFPQTLRLKANRAPMK
ncbi:MAG: hypothetical protein GXP27_11775 [Planctomycetes bacterium]|nr:hypothetical protein [Planctomycetota bacterium]